MNCSRDGCRCDEATFEQGGKHYCGEACAEAELLPATRQAGGGACGHPDCAAV